MEGNDAIRCIVAELDLCFTLCIDHNLQASTFVSFTLTGDNVAVFTSWHANVQLLVQVGRAFVVPYGESLVTTADGDLVVVVGPPMRLGSIACHIFETDHVGDLAPTMFANKSIAACTVWSDQRWHQIAVCVLRWPFAEFGVSVETEWAHHANSAIWMSQGPGGGHFVLFRGVIREHVSIMWFVPALIVVIVDKYQSVFRVREFWPQTPISQIAQCIVTSEGMAKFRGEQKFSYRGQYFAHIWNTLIQISHAHQFAISNFDWVVVIVNTTWKTIIIEIGSTERHGWVTLIDWIGRWAAGAFVHFVDAGHVVEDNIDISAYTDSIASPHHVAERRLIPRAGDQFEWNRLVALKPGASLHYHVFSHWRNLRKSNWKNSIENRRSIFIPISINTYLNSTESFWSQKALALHRDVFPFPFKQMDNANATSSKMWILMRICAVNSNDAMAKATTKATSFILGVFGCILRTCEFDRATTPSYIPVSSERKL